MTKIQLLDGGDTTTSAAQHLSKTGMEDCTSRIHYVGVDVGTSSARACIIDQGGELVGHASERIKQWQPQPGFYEQSTSDIWHGVCCAVRSAIVQSGIEPNTVCSIAFAATCSLAVFTHDTDKPVAVTECASARAAHNVILWMDRRADIESEFINEKGHKLLKHLGGAISVLMELPKVLWLKKNTPEEIFDRCAFYDLNDALAHIATENTQTLCTTACEIEALPLGVDGSIKGWNKEFLADIGLEDLAGNDFKRIGGVCKHGRYPSAGTPIGHLSQKAAQDLGLLQSVVVGSGIIDSYAGWVGTVGAQVETSDDRNAFPLHTRLALVAGTTCHIVTSEDPFFVNGIWGPYKDWVLPGFWMSEGGQTASGHLLQHVLEIHPAYREAMSLAESHKLSIYDFLNGYLQQMCVDTNAPNISHMGRYFFFYGDLFGNRSPIADSTMSGSVVGITADKSLKSLAIQYYGVLEFLALQTHQIISEMNSAGHCIRSIFMSGSQCQNEILVSLIATACNMLVVTPKYMKTAVCCGVAVLAAKAATMDYEGDTENIWSVMQRLTKPGKIILPADNKGVVALLAVKYKVFLEQCERQRVFRTMVDQVTLKQMPVPWLRSSSNSRTH